MMKNPRGKHENAKNKKIFLLDGFSFQIFIVEFKVVIGVIRKMKIS